MNALVFIDFGRDPLAIDKAMYAIVQRKVQIERYLDHKSQAKFARRRAADTGYEEWMEVASNELALAAYCRSEALRLGRELRGGDPKVVRLPERRTT